LALSAEVKRFTTFSVCRLYNTLEFALNNGWVRVEPSTVRHNYEYQGVTELNSEGRRSEQSGANIFRRLISDAFLEHIAACTNVKLHRSEEKARRGIDADDIWSFVVFIVCMIGYRVDDLRRYRDDPTRSGITARKYKDVNKYLSFDLVVVTAEFNKTLKEVTKVKTLSSNEKHLRGE
jgi:hypothetical protein